MDKENKEKLTTARAWKKTRGQEKGRDIDRTLGRSGRAGSPPSEGSRCLAGGGGLRPPPGVPVLSGEAFFTHSSRLSP